MVRDHNAAGSGFQSFLSALHRHDSLQNERLFCPSGNLTQLVHRLAAGGRLHIFQKGQARGVDVHGDGEWVRCVGQLHLLLNQLHIPGLDGGHAVSVAGGDGLHRALHHGGIGAVAGKGGNACGGAGRY
ncbi:hypothetical protein SDC9_107164 [bioreactor metagenome]|uniref:Uncharacterized protein n=1 Tax=bioreactor metagenome TaxID=1076179 RepID=A0A645BAX0_9ZZZZ